MRGKEIAIDIGTSNTLFYIKDQGIVLNEPTIVAINRNNNKILAYGYEAQRMIGKTPINIEVKKPLKFASIDQFDIAKEMLKKFIEKIGEGRKNIRAFARAKVLVGVPSGVTQVERKGIEEVIREAGAREVKVVKSVVAAAIGAGASINQPKITFIIDVGGGTTDIAAITLGGVLVENSVKIGGNNFDIAIIQYLKKQYNINIGEITAENVKIKIGDALAENDEIMKVTGQDLTTGLPIQVSVSNKEILEAIQQPLWKIIEAVKKVIEQCPPESAADILENGALLTGGGSLLKNFEKLLKSELNIKINRVDNPLLIVIQGLGITLNHLDLLNSMMLEYSPRDIQNIKEIPEENKPEE